MKTPARPVLLIACSILVIGACTTGARQGTGPSGDPPAASPGGSTAGGTGDGSTGAPGAGIGQPGLPSTVDPGLGEPTVVVPKPGRLAPHPVGATRIEGRVDGRKVVVRLIWWSGVAPCSVLDSVDVAPSGKDIVLTIREGADRLGVACIELAMLKATVVDLGELEPGTYAISAGGDAPPIQVVVS
jgi:hypothetical protein